MDPSQAYYSQRLKEKNGLIYTKENWENQQPLNSKEQKTVAWNIQSITHTTNTEISKYTKQKHNWKETRTIQQPWLVTSQLQIGN